MRFRPEITLTRPQLTEPLLEHYSEKRAEAEAFERLGFAISELREIKMQLSQERALKHKEIPGA